MRMRQSLAQFEASLPRGGRTSPIAAPGAPAPGGGRSAPASGAWSASRKQGKLRFALLALSIIATAVIVTIVMFETLALLVG